MLHVGLQRWTGLAGFRAAQSRAVGTSTVALLGASVDRGAGAITINA